MLERSLLVVIFIFSVFFAFTVAAQVPAAAETDIFRPDKNDIFDWMNQASKMPAAQQNERVAAALKGISSSDSKTPRSDFQLCLGLAYLGNADAQRCVGYAYEKGVGIVDDMLEAHVWFDIAHGGGSAESQTDVTRVLLLLNSAYPAPTEEELEQMTKDQKEIIVQYQKEFRK